MLKNQSGSSMVEIIPLLAVFVMLLNFSLGFFGIIHSGILQSVAARNYTFETFRNRAQLHYLRDIQASDMSFTYKEAGFRFHGITSENAGASRWIVTQRPIRFTETTEVQDVRGAGEHNTLKGITSRQLASEAGVEEGVSPAWIRVIYGICLDAKCGDS